MEGENPNYGFVNFDGTGGALLALFQVGKSNNYRDSVIL